MIVSVSLGIDNILSELNPCAKFLFLFSSTIEMKQEIASENEIKSLKLNKLNNAENPIFCKVFSFLLINKVKINLLSDRINKSFDENPLTIVLILLFNKASNACSKGNLFGLFSILENIFSPNIKLFSSKNRSNSIFSTNNFIILSFSNNMENSNEI